MTTSQYTNIAFISYKREDEEWAKWLQKKLEHYKLPTEIRKQNPNMEFSKNPRHVFKDTTDLSGGVLAKAIKEGLDSSKFLIVICSPRAAKSEWVCKEVQDFIDSGREEYIIPFIIDGEAYAKNPENECFPEALKSLVGERELLGININENGRDFAAVKVVARMFELRIDTLWNRFQREKRKKRREKMVILSLIIFILALAASILSLKNMELKKAKSSLIINKVRLLSEKAVNLVEDGDVCSAQKICLYTYDLLKDNDIPCIPELERALRISQDSILQDNTSIAILREHDDGLRSLSLTQSGDKLFSGGGHQAKLWTTHDNKCILTLLHPRNIWTCDISPDGSLLATADNINCVRLWKDDGKSVKEFKDLGMHIKFTKDSKFIIANNRSAVSIINTKTLKIQEQEYVVELCNPGYIEKVAISDDNKMLAVAYRLKKASGMDIAISIFDISKQKIISTCVGHRLDVQDMEFTKDGKYLISCSYDGSMRKWNVTDGCEIFKVEVHNGKAEVFSIDINENRHEIAVGADHSILIYDLLSGLQKKEIIKHKRIVRDVILTNSGDSLYSCSRDKTIRLWNHKHSKSKLERIPDKDYFLSIKKKTGDFNHESEFYKYERSGDTLNISYKNKSVLQIKAPYWVNSYAIQYSKKKLALVYDNFTIGLWDILKQKEMILLEGHEDDVYRCSFSRDGNYIVSQSDNVKIWDCNTGLCLLTLIRDYYPHDVCFSQDGHDILILTGKDDNVIEKYEFATVEEIAKKIREQYGNNIFTEYEKSYFLIE